MLKRFNQCEAATIVASPGHMLPITGTGGALKCRNVTDSHNRRWLRRLSALILPRVAAREVGPTGSKCYVDAAREPRVGVLVSTKHLIGTLQKYKDHFHLRIYLYDTVTHINVGGRRYC